MIDDSSVDDSFKIFFPKKRTIRTSQSKKRKYAWLHGTRFGLWLEA